MGEMGVNVRCSAFRKQLVDKITSLEQMLESSGFTRAQKTSERQPQSFCISLGPFDGQRYVMAQIQGHGSPEILREIVHICLYLLDAVMAKGLAGMAHGEQMDFKAHFFQQKNLVRNECLGNARIAFKDESQHLIFGMLHNY